MEIPVSEFDYLPDQLQLAQHELEQLQPLIRAYVEAAHNKTGRFDAAVNARSVPRPLRLSERTAP